MGREGWGEEALCAQVDPELFFEGYGLHRDAKAICARCPALLDCGQAALDNEEEFGIWGGLTAPERLLELREIHGPDYRWPGEIANFPTERKVCRAGHDQTEENLVLSTGGWRCRPCQQIANHESYLRLKAKRAAA